MTRSLTGALVVPDEGRKVQYLTEVRSQRSEVGFPLIVEDSGLAAPYVKPKSEQYCDGANLLARRSALANSKAFQDLDRLQNRTIQFLINSTLQSRTNGFCLPEGDGAPVVQVRRLVAPREGRAPALLCILRKPRSPRVSLIFRSLLYRCSCTWNASYLSEQNHVPARHRATIHTKHTRRQERGPLGRDAVAVQNKWFPVSYSRK